MLAWPVATCGCEALTLKKEEQRQIRLIATEMCISCPAWKASYQVTWNFANCTIVSMWWDFPTISIESSAMVGLNGKHQMVWKPMKGWLDSTEVLTGLSGANLLWATEGIWSALTRQCSKTVVKWQRRIISTWHDVTYCIVRPLNCNSFTSYVRNN